MPACAPKQGLAASARLFSSALQQRYPVDIEKFRAERPLAESEKDFRLSQQSKDIQNHKIAVNTLCKYLSGAVALCANEQHPIDPLDFSRFLVYLQKRSTREDLPFYHNLGYYLRSTRRDFAGEMGRLFSSTPEPAAAEFLFAFSKVLRQTCREFMEAHPLGAITHHLGHATIILETIFESELLPSLQSSGRLQPEEIERIRDAGKLEKTPPPATYL